MARITRSLAKADPAAAAAVVAVNKEAFKTYEPRVRTRKNATPAREVNRRAPAPVEAEIEAHHGGEDNIVAIEAPVTPPRRANAQNATAERATPREKVPAAPAHPLLAVRHPHLAKALDLDDEPLLAATPADKANNDALAAELEEVNFGLGARDDDDDEVMTLIGTPMSNMKIDLLKANNLEGAFAAMDLS
ncbi:hypothetical protein JCM9279_004375 [Rhodotorula babjevae]